MHKIQTFFLEMAVPITYIADKTNYISTVYFMISMTALMHSKLFFIIEDNLVCGIAFGRVCIRCLALHLAEVCEEIIGPCLRPPHAAACAHNQSSTFLPQNCKAGHFHLDHETFIFSLGRLA